jgi:lysophospholipase L1-like esterase
MNETCRQNNIEFVVTVIPTKEMVFSDFLENKRELPLSDVLDKLIANERLARERTFKFFNDSNILYVDTLPALKRSVEQELYTHTAADMHPNKNGYRAIAEAISQSFKTEPIAK